MNTTEAAFMRFSNVLELLKRKDNINEFVATICDMTKERDDKTIERLSKYWRINII